MMKTMPRLAGLLMLLAAAAATAGETPSILVQANAPGWITVTYEHSGMGEVSWYFIEREGAGPVYNSAAPNGQFIDANLPPDTAFAYRVCAVYEDEEEPTCTAFFAARTMVPPGKPANFDPPLIRDVAIATDEIRITWGQTGDYTRILLRFDDDRGNLGQPEVSSVPNGSYTFRNLQPGTRYHIGLKGCSKTLLGSSCGPWSPRVTLTTALPAEPLQPPGKPSLKVSATTNETVTLAFTVKLSGQNADDKIVLYRDGQPYQHLEGRSAIGGLQGSYTDTVSTQHVYQVCYERLAPPSKRCSSKVRDPQMRMIAADKVLPKKLVTKKPSVDMMLPNPDVAVGEGSTGDAAAPAVEMLDPDIFAQ